MPINTVTAELGKELTAESYQAVMSARQADRDAREAFRNIVLQLVRPGERVFDFGAGPGLDAKFFAHHGMRVSAYDNDPRMRAAFVAYCDAEMRSGQITLLEGDYPWFLRSVTDTQEAALIMSNFAPLNLVDELVPLFAALRKLTAPGGRLLASVLNPDFAGDMRYRWWWRNRVRYWRAGEFAVSGVGGPIWRRSTEVYARRAHPHFSLRAVLRGLPRRRPVDLRSSRALALRSSQYLFLLFESQ